MKLPPFEPTKKIGIVALAGPMDAETLLEGEALLQRLGFNVLIAPSCFERDRYLAGTSDEERALDLQMLFADEEIGAILNMRGGYGSNRLMPYLKNFDFSRYPKPFIGYSDITYIHLFLNQTHRMKTYHGPMIKDLLTEHPQTLYGFFQTALAEKKLVLSDVSYLNPSQMPLLGQSIGGNLTVVASTLGTAQEIDTRGRILFLEEVGEAPYSVDRLLMQLIYSGKIHDCVGLVLGDFAGEDQAGVWETIRRILLPTQKTIAYGISAGHSVPNVTIPLAAPCLMDAQRATLHFG